MVLPDLPGTETDVEAVCD